MIIRKKRIRSLTPYTRRISDGAEFTVGVRIGPEQEPVLPSLGFTVPWADGQSLLSSPKHGPASTKNAEGWFVVHKDRPKETAVRQFEWTWIEYHGDDEVEQSRIIDQEYERYPRTFYPPPAIELCTGTTPQGRMLVASRRFTKGVDDEVAVLAINVLLEVFGEAELLHTDLNAMIPMRVRRLNWEVLPAGEHPWQALEPRVRDVLNDQGPRKRPVFEHRWSTICRYAPDFVAVGREGFSGYLIFGFESRYLYVLESAFYGNATYVLDRDWPTLSTFSKAELLDAGLHRDRIVHRADWNYHIHALLRPRDS